MALDNKLKSEMAIGATYSEQSRMAPIPERTTSRPVFESYAQEPRTKEEKTTPKAIPVSQPVTNEGGNNTTESLLKAIEKQLKSLNQSVADLEQEVSAYKNPDYRVIFSKIDSARYSIEKMLSSVNDTQISTSNGDLTATIAKLEELIAAVSEKQDRNDRQLAQTLRENANFQIQVRQGMQKDIDALKKQQSGEQFNSILKEIASMYVEYQSLFEDESISDLSRKNLRAFFEQMEDLLTDYDAEITRSEIGTVRKTKITKIIGKVPTAEKAKHNTIAMSRKPGVLRGKTVLYPEFVDVFVYDPTIIPEVTTSKTDAKPDIAFEENEITNPESSTIPSEREVTGEGFETVKTETSKDIKNKEIIAENVDQTNG